MCRYGELLTSFDTFDNQVRNYRDYIWSFVWSGVVGILEWSPMRFGFAFSSRYPSFTAVINLCVYSNSSTGQNRIQMAMIGVQRDISYEEIRDLKYLDTVVSEALRKWPPAGVTDRVCTKDLEYKDGDLELHFKKGDNLWIPIYAFHHDPKFFPEPDRFYPERFSEENRETMAHADAYMPFGLGPRSCIANRFALMEVKALIYFIVLNFELVPTKKTNIPVKITNIMGAMSKDIFFGFKVRE